MHIGLKNKDFVKIKYGNKFHYGGNQAWFDESLARDSACGTVAATNILTYMNVWKHRGNVYEKNEYKDYMDEVYTRLHPVNISYPRGGLDLFYKFAKLLHLSDLSLGIPSVSRFIRGVRSLAVTRGLDLEARNYPETIFSRWSLVAAMDFIARALEKDRPVALINAFNKHLKGFKYPLDDGRITMADFERHWVVITEMEVDKDGREVYIYVSSWGERVRLNLSDIVKGGVFTSMVYFH